MIMRLIRGILGLGNRVMSEEARPEPNLAAVDEALARSPDEGLKTTSEEHAVRTKANYERLTRWFEEEEDRQIQEVRQRLARAREVLDPYSEDTDER